MKWTLLVTILFSNFLFASHFELFDNNIEAPNGYAKQTFVFFIQGAADHHVPKDFKNPKKWIDADAYDAKVIEKYLLTNKNCNGIILHVQRSGYKFGRNKKTSATFLKVFAQGQRVAKMYTPILNSADPNSLTSLLKFAQKTFSDSDLHLIYRGHGFYPSYDPQAANQQIKAFDINYEESPYGIEVFYQSLKDAHLKNLASISFAACKMDHKKVKYTLSIFNVHVIATDQNVIQSPDSHGFDYSFILQVLENSNKEDVAKLISKLLLR